MAASTCVGVTLKLSAREKQRRLRLEKSEAGSVATEFLMVVPAFLLLIFLVIELALMWADRHIVKLAAFEAARSYLTEGETNPCLDEQALGVAPQDVQQAQKRGHRNAKRSAALKIAAVSPSVAWLASSAGMNINSDTVNRVTSAGGPFASAFAHLAVRIPSAMALTRVACERESDGSIRATVTYYRAPRMPFAKTVIWATFSLGWIQQQLADHGLGGALKLELDDMYFGVKAHSPALAEVQDRFGDMRERISGALDTVQGVTGSLEEAGDLLRSVPGMSDIADNYFDAANTEFHNAVSAARQGVDGGLDAVQGPLDDSIQAAQRAIDSQATVVTALIYAVPEELRLVPMTQSVRLAPAKVENEEGNWDGAQAVLVAPFRKGGSSIIELTAERWRQWAEGMSAHDDQHLQPNPAAE